MDTEAKAKILSDFYINCIKIEEWKPFIEAHDLGLPYALGATLDHLELKPAGVTQMNNTWDHLIEVLGVEDKDYADLGELFDTAIAAGAEVVQ